jgi:hypothetical protein
MLGGDGGEASNVVVEVCAASHRRKAANAASTIVDGQADARITEIDAEESLVAHWRRTRTQPREAVPRTPNRSAMALIAPRGSEPSAPRP